MKRAERLPAAFKVELKWQDAIAHLTTRNISDTGIFLVAENSELPPVGSTVNVRLQGSLGCGEEPPILTMRVVRAEDGGIGLMFVDDDTPA